MAILKVEASVLTSRKVNNVHCNLDANASWCTRSATKAAMIMISHQQKTLMDSDKYFRKSVTLCMQLLYM
jgi:hypothetical protein